MSLAENEGMMAIVEDSGSISAQAAAEAMALLREAARELKEMLAEEMFIAETPLEVEWAMRFALDGIHKACHCLRSPDDGRKPAVALRRRSPTRQQGQFLAFIREFISHNEAGRAPSHAELQRFFGLTPPSVNSMLHRLEKLGFIRRIAGRARAIELSISAEQIPPLDRPFLL